VLGIRDPKDPEDLCAEDPDPKDPEDLCAEDPDPKDPEDLCAEDPAPRIPKIFSVLRIPTPRIPKISVLKIPTPRIPKISWLRIPKISVLRMAPSIGPHFLSLLVILSRLAGTRTGGIGRLSSSLKCQDHKYVIFVKRTLDCSDFYFLTEWSIIKWIQMQNRMVINISCNWGFKVCKNANNFTQ
jgi:hypothetical protein